MPNDELVTIEWSADTLAWLKGMTSRFDVDSADRLYKMASDPVTAEPLSFAASDMLLSIARAKGRNLVANVPDDLRLPTGGDLTVHVALKSLADHAKLAIDEDWITVRPNLLTERFSREALRDVIRAYRANGAIGLDEMAVYAAAERRPASHYLVIRYLRLFAPPSV